MYQKYSHKTDKAKLTELPREIYKLIIIIKDDNTPFLEIDQSDKIIKILNN